MNEIYLPTLTKIEVKNFNLYKEDISYEFVKGINLIIGGNGVGKTTFINLIKYGLIGLYKKNLDSRTYKEQRRDIRTQLPRDYFKNRMKSEGKINIDAQVTLEFFINETFFRVTRNLYDIKITEVFIKYKDVEYFLDGTIIKQEKYEQLEQAEKEKSLQYQYESLVAEKSNFHDFDDMIFFVNEILYFDEERNTILWNSAIQSAISSKYFNDPLLDEEYEEAKRKARYHNSRSRHLSEDMRAISKIIEKVQNNIEEDNDINIVKKLNELNNDITIYSNELDRIQHDRKTIETKIKLLTSNRANIQKQYQELEEKIRKEESNVYKEVWEKLHPDYDIFLESIKTLCLCPLCNKEMDIRAQQEILKSEENCILCHSSIKKEQKDTENLNIYKEDAEKLLQLIRNDEIEIVNEENNLSALDLQYSKKKTVIFNKQRYLREMEHQVHNEQAANEESNSNSNAYKAMLNEIAELEIQKKEQIELSKYNSNFAIEIFNKIEDNLVKITADLSNIFSSYAEDFLGLDSKLTFDDFNNEGAKRFVPIINGKERLFAEALSESQRFFIDQSFRMSILSYFYTKPTFFICETPDSSLDISYEANAADIYLRYLEKPNSLVLTSNLNNSEFLEQIIDQANEINYINLLEIGNSSVIQRTNDKLHKISKGIEEKINAKRVRENL